MGKSKRADNPYCSGSFEAGAGSDRATLLLPDTQQIRNRRRFSDKAPERS